VEREKADEARQVITSSQSAPEEDLTPGAA